MERLYEASHDSVLRSALQINVSEYTAMVSKVF